MSRNGWQRSTSAFFIGLGVGAGLALLLAPMSGEEIRDEIVGAVRDGVNDVLAQGSNLGRRVQRTFEDAQERVRNATEAGGHAYREAKTASS
jgi:gas vesicle protein